jgi:hypothetical protein
VSAEEVYMKAVNKKDFEKLEGAPETAPPGS